MPEFNPNRSHRKVLNDEDVEGLLKLHTNPMTLALISLLYLYGCRISEALELTKESFWEDSIYLWAIIPTLKKRKTSVPLKHEDRKLNINRSSSFVHHITTYVNTLQPGQKLFPISRQQAYYSICLPFGRKNKEDREEAYKELNVWLHLFRHSVATQMAISGANALQLKDWFGWGSLRPAEPYLHLTGEMTDNLSNMRIKRGWSK